MVITQIVSNYVTSLLLKGGYVNGSVPTTDVTGKTITAFGDAQCSTAKPHFNRPGTSIAFSGAGSFLSTPDHPDFDFAAGDFTLEAWVFPTSAIDCAIIAKASATAMRSVCLYGGANAVLKVSTDGATWTHTVSGGTLPLNQWTHVAATRSGGFLNLFVNGVQATPVAIASPVFTGLSAFTVGAMEDVTSPFTGYMDQVNILKGAARYTVPFTPKWWEFANATPANSDPYYDKVTVLLRGEGGEGSTSILDESPFVAPTGYAAILGTLNPIAYWKLEEVNGAIAKNAVVGGIDGTYSASGVTRQASNSPISSGRYPAFNAAGGTWVGVNTGITTDYTALCSMALWVMPDAIQTDASPTLIGKIQYYAGAVAAFPIRLHYAAGSVYLTLSKGDDFTAETVLSAPGVEPGVWSHVVAVYRASGVCQLYVNGAVAASTTINYTISNSGASIPWTIAGTSEYAAGVGDTSFCGGISNVSLHNTALSSAAIAQLYGTSGIQTGDADFASVSLLMKFDGSNGSTVMLDSSSSPHTAVVTGSAALSTIQIKSGLSSLRIPSGSSVNVTTTSQFDFGTGDFTIEGWFFPVSLPASGSAMPVSKFSAWAGNLDIVFRLSSAGVMSFLGGNGVAISVSANTLMSAGSWYHVAAVRSGDTTSLYINGLLQNATSAVVVSIPNATTTLVLGKGSDGTEPFDGYIDDFRVTKGVCRYTGTFSPPSSFPTTGLSASGDPAFGSVSLLLSGTGTNGSSSVLDTGPFIRSVTNTGVTISTAQSKNGGSSLLFNGAARLSLATSPDLIFGTGDFTVEFWVRFNTVGAYRRLVTTTLGGFVSGTFAVRLTNTSTFYAICGGALGVTSSVVATTGVWYHIAVTRVSGTMSLYVDGALQGTEYSANSTTEYVQSIGGYYSVGSTEYHDGYLDDLRITKGIARYTGNFVPPYTAFPTSEPPSDGDPQFGYVSALLHLDGANASTVFTDVCSNTWTKYGLPVISTAQSKFGGASLRLPGTAGLTTPAGPMNFGANDFTVELWVNVDVATNPQDFLNNYGGAASTSTFVIQLSSNASINVSMYYGSASFSLNSAPGSIVAGTWYHLAAVRSGGNATLYIDGVSVSTLSTLGTTALNTMASNVRIGMESDAGAYSVVGYIDEVRITKGAARYLANFTKPFTTFAGSSSQVGDQHFAKNSLLLHMDSGTTATPDSGPIAKTVTITGAVITGAQSKFGGKSLFINGGNQYLSIPSHVDFDLPGDFTLEMWVYPTSLSQYNTVFNIGQYNSGCMLRLNSSGWEWYMNSGGNSGGSPTPVALNTWSHIAVCRSGSNVYHFLNGVLVATTAAVAIPQGAVMIGASAHTPASEIFPGYIDELRLTKGVARYVSAFTPSTTAFPDTAVLTTNISGNIHINTDITVSGTGSLEFDGLSDGVEFAEASRGAFGIGDFTIEMWIRVRSIHATYARSLVSNGWYSGGTPNGWLIHQANVTGRISFYASTDNLNWDMCSGLGIINAPVLDQWYHIAVTRKGNIFRTFADGQLVVQALPSIGSLYSTVGPRIGGGKAVGGTDSFDGFIDDLRITKGVCRYESNFTPPNPLPPKLLSPVDPFYQNVSLQFKSNGVDGYPSFIDTSATVKPITATNVADSKTVSLINTAIKFDGTGDYLQVAAHPDFNLDGPSYTIEGWVQLIALPASNKWMAIVTRSWGLPLANDAYFLGVKNDSVAGMQVQFSSADAQNTTCVCLANWTGATVNQWMHFAVVRLNNMTTVYCNGVAGTPMMCRNGKSNKSIESQPLNIGVAYPLHSTDPSFMNGYIADLRITRGAALYLSNFVPPTDFVQSIAGTWEESPALMSKTSGWVGNAGSFGGGPQVGAFPLDHFVLKRPMGAQLRYAGLGRIRGTVKESSLPTNKPINRKVLLFREVGMILVAEQWSNPTTGEYDFKYYDHFSNYTVISYDYMNNYRSVIANNIVPETMT